MSTTTLSRITINALASTITRLERLLGAAFRLYLRDSLSSHRYSALADIIKGQLEAARSTVADLLDAAPWGQQLGEHGRVFVQRFGGWPQDQLDRVRVNVDRVPVVTVTYGWDYEARQRVTVGVAVHDRVAELARRTSERSAGRLANEAYEQRLGLAAEAIRAGALPPRWEIWEGQKGGRLVLAPGEYVGIAGALRRAGISPGDDASATLREELAHAATLRHVAREHRLDARSRRLPASDRRRAVGVCQ